MHLASKGPQSITLDNSGCRLATSSPQMLGLGRPMVEFAVCRPGRLRSKQAVRIGRVLGDDLQHVPMFNDPSLIVEPDVNSRLIMISGPVLEAMKNDIVLLCRSDKAIDGLGGSARVEHQFVEGDHIRLVALQIMHDRLR